MNAGGVARPSRPASCRVTAAVVAGSSVMTAVTCSGLRSRIRATSSFSPTRDRPMALRSSLLDLMVWPLMLVMTSPALMPAFSAAEPSLTCETSTPWVFGRLSDLAMSGVSE